MPQIPSRTLLGSALFWMGKLQEKTDEELDSVNDLLRKVESDLEDIVIEIEDKEDENGIH